MSLVASEPADRPNVNVILHISLKMILYTQLEGVFSREIRYGAGSCPRTEANQLSLFFP